MHQRGGRVAFTAAYAAFVLLVTTWPFDLEWSRAALARGWARVEWVVVYRDARGWPLADFDLVGNLVLLAPLGLALAFVGPARGAWVRAVVAGLALALVAEALQMLSAVRTPQLADVLRNALGAGIGGALGAWARRGFPRR